MNNSQVRIPDEPVNTEQLEEREAKLVRIIGALEKVQESAEWSSLKQEIFDGKVENLRNLVLTEAKKEKPDTERLNRLTGQLEWAEKFSDLGKLAEQYRKELLMIRNRYGRPE